jgi:sugar O-acyltransferase (sialic acid O-acetyltransferase NeuD family)
MPSNNINIIGFDTNMLSIIFDTLNALKFDGSVNIWKNDDRASMSEYDLGIKHVIAQLNLISMKDTDNFILSTSNPGTKKILLSDSKQYIPDIMEKMIQLVHPTSYIAGNTKISGGSLIEAGVTIAAFSLIGHGVIVGRNASIGHHNIIGDWSTINPGCTLVGKVTIGEYSTIGPGTTLINGVTIGSNTIIGAGSVVTRDIPDNVVAYGNPCKIIRENVQ